MKDVGGSVCLSDFGGRVQWRCQMQDIRKRPIIVLQDDGLHRGPCYAEKLPEWAACSWRAFVMVRHLPVCMSCGDMSSASVCMGGYGWRINGRRQSGCTPAAWAVGRCWMMGCAEDSDFGWWILCCAMPKHIQGIEADRNRWRMSECLAGILHGKRISANASGIGVLFDRAEGGEDRMAAVQV